MAGIFRVDDSFMTEGIRIVRFLLLLGFVVSSRAARAQVPRSVLLGRIDSVVAAEMERTRTPG
ncbi:MAG: hypothetical protein ABI647_25245, partial [Gemmatimonadota bacterium]